VSPIFDAPCGDRADARCWTILLARGADGLIVTGSETDVCVLSTILGAVDHGFRVIVVRDGICSSSDEGHEALLRVYHQRFTFQIETTDAETVLSRWS
jgi:nicotinamidase-related amidase